MDTIERNQHHRKSLNSLLGVGIVIAAVAAVVIPLITDAQTFQLELSAYAPYYYAAYATDQQGDSSGAWPSTFQISN